MKFQYNLYVCIGYILPRIGRNMSVGGFLCALSGAGLGNMYILWVCPSIHLGDPPPPQNLTKPPWARKGPQIKKKTNIYPPKRLADKYQYKEFYSILRGGGGVGGPPLGP